MGNVISKVIGVFLIATSSFVGGAGVGADLEQDRNRQQREKEEHHAQRARTQPDQAAFDAKKQDILFRLHSAWKKQHGGKPSIPVMDQLDKTAGSIVRDFQEKYPQDRADTAKLRKYADSIVEQKGVDANGKLGN